MVTLRVQYAMTCGLLLRMVFLSMAPGDAQAPYEGLGKATLAAERDPLGALAFLQRYMGATPSGDSCPANVCRCKAGDSESPVPWSVSEGRAQLLNPRQHGRHGRCVLHTSTAGLAEGRPEAVAVMPGKALGEDCNYTESAEVLAGIGDAGYVVNAHTADTCCKSCSVVENCIGATFLPAENVTRGRAATRRLQGMTSDEGFGIHLPAVAAHKTTGGLTVAEVERIVEHKLGNLSTFDAWMDFSVAVFTADLDTFLASWDSHDVRYFAAVWRSQVGEAFHSVFVHVPKSQLIFEVIGRSRQLRMRTDLFLLEQRLSADRLAAIADDPPLGLTLKVVKVSRAATDLTALDDFYITGMRTRKVHSVDSSGLGVRCYLWDGAAADLCFVTRPDNATAGRFKVRDFEKMLKSVASHTLTSRTCGMNRWMDNHYQLSLMTAWTHFDYIADYLKDNPTIPYVCTNISASDHGVLRFFFDPTGWAVQLEPMAMAKLPGCQSAVYSASYPICDGGVCASMASGVPSSIV